MIEHAVLSKLPTVTCVESGVCCCKNNRECVGGEEIIYYLIVAEKGGSGGEKGRGVGIQRYRSVEWPRDLYSSSSSTDFVLSCVW